MPHADVLHGDSREVLAMFPDDYFDSVVCDPPYALVSIGKRFGSPDAAPVTGNDAYMRASKRFMGRNWDTGETAFDPAFWFEVLRVLKPGGHLVAFGGTRSYHRLACAVEDAGFEIRDMVSWNYGSGFPKSHSVIKDLEKKGLACRCPKTMISSHHVREQDMHDLRGALDAFEQVSGDTQQNMRAAVLSESDISESNLTSAQGHAVDTVRNVRNTGPSTSVSCEANDENILQRHVSFDDFCRTVATNGGKHEGAESRTAIRAEQPGMEGRRDPQAAEGKLQRSEIRQGAGVGVADGSQGWVHHGASPSYGADVRVSANTNGSGEPRGPRPVEQSSKQSDALPNQRRSQAWGGWPVCGGCGKPIIPEGLGTALKPAIEPIVLARKSLARGATVASNVLAHGAGALNIDGCRVGASGRPSIIPNHKPGFADVGVSGGSRAAGVTDLGRWPANVMHDGSDEVVGVFPEGASRYFYCAKASKADRNEGCDDLTSATTSDGPAVAADNAYQRGKTERSNTHPTVKPTALMRYLCRLVTPPGGVVLDPFCGSGSTGKAAVLEGFGFVGIEREAEYVEIARARVASARPA